MQKIGKYLKSLILVFGFLISVFTLSHPVTAQTQDINLTITFSNLADPGEDHYEGWLIVDGSPVSTGKFTVNSAGKLVDLDGNEISSFTVKSVNTDKLSKFVLSLEPKGDTDSVPASINPLAGDFVDGKANLSPNLGVTLSSISGVYILATPTDGADTNENSGIWFLDPSGPSVGLNLPDLTGTDWVYEGWVVIDGVPVTTGKFNSTNQADDFNGYSSTQASPPFPGEDFLVNAPSGLTFPTDIAGAKAVISIEPRNDNSPAPFQFKPLVGDIPSDAQDHVAYQLTDMSDSLATGTVSFTPISNASFDGLLGAIMVLLAIGVIFRIKKRTN